MDDFWSVSDSFKVTVDTLHRDLKTVNFQSDCNLPYTLNVRLLEDHTESLKELSTHMTLHSPSWVLNVQQHRDVRASDASRLLLIESIYGPCPSLTEAPDQVYLTRLERRPSLPPPSDDMEIETWGIVAGESTPPLAHLSHAVYHDRDTAFVSHASLDDLLKSEKYKTGVKPFHIIRLARIVLCSHLQFSCLRERAEGSRPSNYRYYRETQEPDMGEIGDVLIEPWLQLGFGQNPPRARLGRTSRSTRAHMVEMLELGLLLYQIGTGTSLSYGNGTEGLTRLKIATRANLRVLENRMGTVYAEIVQGFLEFPTHQLSYARKPAMQQREDLQVKRAISALFEQSSSMEGTMREVGDISAWSSEQDIRTDWLVTEAGRILQIALQTIGERDAEVGTQEGLGTIVLASTMT